MYGGYGAAGGMGGAGMATANPQVGPDPMGPQMMFPTKSPFARGQRRSFNLLAVVGSLIIPWGIFMAVMAIQAFQLHNEHPELCYVLDAIIILTVVAIGVMAVLQWRKREESDSSTWVWSAFMFVTSLAGWIVGLVVGNLIYRHCMLPYYDVTSLQVYPNVDVGVMKGQQLMDAGQVEFVPGTYVDPTRSMGFRNNGMYCVAPIVTQATSAANATASTTYDFWAVGLNCCNGHSQDFHCGEYANPLAKSGLRLMRDSQRSFFRLAVQQAEAAFNMKANHPLFFYYMQDPHLEMQAYQDDGYRWCLIGLFSWLGFQLAAVFANLAIMSKVQR